MTVRPLTALFFALPLLAGLAGCDQVQHRLGLEDPSAKEARDDAEGKAVGSACRQSGRAIEDCYAIYHWLPKASIFAGWREMNDYMLENKLEEVRPVLPPPQPPGNGRKKARGAAAASGETPTGSPGAEATAGAASAPGTPPPLPPAPAAVQPPAAR